MKRSRVFWPLLLVIDFKLFTKLMGSQEPMEPALMESLKGTAFNIVAVNYVRMLL